jgi:hypothetical protein
MSGGDMCGRELEAGERVGERDARRGGAAALLDEAAKRVGGREHDLGAARSGSRPLPSTRSRQTGRRGGGGLHARQEEARELVGDDQAGAGGEGGEQALAGARAGST